MTFTATISGAISNIIPIYAWTVSAGRIVRGQGSSSITVDTVGFGGSYAYTATVSVAGLDSNCPATASCYHCALPPFSMKFDTYGLLDRAREMVRLNDFATQLQQSPGARGYVLVYRKSRAAAGEATRAGTRAKEYLIKTGGIAADRIVTVDAGPTAKLKVELWVVPAGADPYVPERTTNPRKAKNY
jgi:hypothetical protein